MAWEPTVYRSRIELSRTASAITWGSYAILAASCAGMVWLYGKDLATSETEAWIVNGTLLFCLICVAGAWLSIVLLTPRSYELTHAELIVNRWALSPRLAIRDITAVKAPHREELGFLLRLFGSGGAGGWWGLFTGKPGKMRIYVGSFDNLVLVERRDGMPWVIAPSDRPAFIAALCGLRPDLEPPELSAA